MSDYSSDSDSYASECGIFSASTGMTPPPNNNNNNPRSAHNASGGRNTFDSLIDDWMGDVGSVVSVDSRVSSSNNRQAINPHDDDIILEAGEENNNNTTPTRSKKKKLVPYTSSKSSSSSTSMTTQETTANHNRNNTSSTSAAVTTRCYLVQGTQTQGSLIEHYSETPVQAYLAYWQPPHDKTIPKFKFTQNWGKSELINATHGDTRGKRAYYSGICQWIRSAKTFNATLSFCNQVPGWECDLYFYFSSLLLQKQTILLRDGETFTKLSMADGVAIVPRGSDFLHYDPRFQCTIDKWLAEGSKLGFASKLDVRAGSAYPKQTSHRAVGDAARPSGGASYNAKARDYARGKEKLEQNKVLADEQRAKEGYEREEAEREATKMASEQASREMRGLEEKERARVEAERLSRLEIASGKKVLGDGKERGNNTMHAEENGIGNEFTLKSDQLLDDDDHDHVRDLKQSDRTVGKKTATTAHATSKTTRSNRKIFDSLHTSSEVEDSRMTTGARVYIRDTHYSWIPATIESEEDDKKRVKVRVSLPNDWEDCTVIPKGGGAGNLRMERIVKLSDYSNSELPLQNLEKDGVTWMGKNDMADLPNLHEAAILYNLKVRHSDGVPYTRVGDIMVAMNPFQWISGLYSEEKKSFYAKNLIWEAKRKESKPKVEDASKSGPLATAASEKQAIGYEHEKLGIAPHVFETASLAYLGLAADGSNQTILVTGESGAGKTETIKIVMNHLATVERSRPSWPESDRDMGGEHGSDTVNRVLRANPVFEAFGNAKTLRNDNSSRFGKFTQLQFDVENASDAERNGRAVPSCLLAGSKVITYLLEKSRVVSMSQGERTYHIFYQLLGAPDDIKQHIWEEGLVGAEISDFTYLSNTSSEDDSLDSGEEWSETIDALSTFGIHGDSFLNVMRSLCVILQLGNLTFEPEVVDGEERSAISSIDALEKLSNLMGVSENEIETAMTKRFMITRGEEFTISLKSSEARDGCDALAKEIYARIFEFLVRNINACTESEGAAKAGYGTISLLDIFGFESFQVNRFEQLCINYANERLQQKYVIDNFRAIKVEYEDEGVNVFDFSLIDNSDVMELLEGKLGLMVQLNEECVRPNGGDEPFVYKLKVVCSDSSRLIQDNLHRPYEFGIRHYAAPIKYDARMFIERNLDKIPPDLLKCACRSTNPLIRDEFQRLSASLEESQSTGLRKRSAATKHLVASKFRTQLTSLMSIIEQSRTRYIRCVKPNKLMKPRTIDHTHTVSQLESAGLVTAIVISRESFPNRLSYEVIMERFKFLTYKFRDCHLDSGDLKRDSEILLSHLLAGITADTHKGRVRPFACGKTKVYFRVGALERIETIRQDYYAERAIQLQTWIRSIQTRHHFLTMKHGTILFQSQVRCHLLRKSFTTKLECALMIQCFIRQIIAKMEFLRQQKNHAATVIQARSRVIKPRKEFKAVRAAAICIQSIVRMTICRKVYAIKKKERDAEYAMESRMTMMQQNFDDASTVGGGTVFSVDEGLLEEVETMFEFLRKEIVVLRKKNTKIKRELADAEAEKRELFNHASSIDHAFALSKIKTEQLTRNNAQMTENSSRHKKEISKLKTELKTQQQAHELQLREMRQEFDMTLDRREVEVKSLQSKLHSTTTFHKREVQMITEEAERKQDDNYTEILRLREEIKRTQDSHQDYLSKLMGVLETTQANRNSAHNNEEVLRKKDSEILGLRNEVAKLRKAVPESGSNNSSNQKEVVKSMKYIVKKNREQRKTRVQELGVFAKQLEDNLLLGDRSQMQRTIDSLNNAIQIGEKHNSKMDREVINMIDNTASFYVPLDATANRNNADYAFLFAENQKLRRKLEKKYTCKRCGHKREKKEYDCAGDIKSEITEESGNAFGASEATMKVGNH